MRDVGDKIHTLFKLSLHALNLCLVPADPVDSLRAQSCWKQRKRAAVIFVFICKKQFVADDKSPVKSHLYTASCISAVHGTDAP